jgi:hypothetical protein
MEILHDWNCLSSFSNVPLRARPTLARRSTKQAAAESFTRLMFLSESKYFTMKKKIFEKLKYIIKKKTKN